MQKNNTESSWYRTAPRLARGAACLALLCAVLLCSCATVPGEKKPPASGPAPADTTTLLNPAVYYHFLSGQQCLADQNWSCALSEFTAALQYDNESAYLHLQICQIHAQQGNFEEARAWCEKAVALDPLNQDPRLLLARIYSALNRLEDAAASYGELIRIAPEEEEPYLALAMIYTAQKNQYKALRALHSLLKINPRSENGLLALGNLYTERQQWKKAEQTYKKAAALDPLSEPPLLHLVTLYESQNNIAAAIQAAEKIITLNPDNYHAREKLAYLQVTAGNLAAALEHYRYVREAKPYRADDITLKIGLIFVEQEQWPAAVEEFTVLFKKSPGDDRVLYYLGSALEKLSRFDEALQMFAAVPSVSRYFSQSQIHRAYILLTQNRLPEAQRVMVDAVALKRDDTDLYRFLASLYEKDGRFLDGITTLREALAIKADDEDLLFYLGVLYDKASLHEESIATMRDVLKLNRNNADALNFIGYTYADKGVNLDEAERLIKKALKLKPNDGYIIDSLGWVYFRQGRFKKAVQKLRQAVRYAPADPVIAEHLGDAYSALGDRQNALRYYEKARELDPSKTAITQKIHELTVQ